MTDEIRKLEDALRTAPAPRRAAKAAALDAALRAFDEEFAPVRQEMSNPMRQTAQKQPGWSRIMSFLRQNLSLRPLLMGGASVAALSLALVVSTRDLPSPGLNPIPPEVQSLDAADKAEPEALVEADEVTAAEITRQMPAPPMEARPALAPTAKRMESARDGSSGSGASSSTFMPMPAPDSIVAERETRDRFAHADANPVKLAAEDPVSTFSVDVDTASYAWIRRSLREGRMPDPASVRVEEMINYFPYDYPAPDSAETPFRVSTTLMDAPWAEGRQLLHIGIRGYQPAVRPRAHFTFLIDTSGSMSTDDKLPLLLTSLRLMLDGMNPDDTVAIVTYAGSSTVALAPTRAAEKGAILDALDALQSGGGTAGAAGIETAFRLAADRFDAAAVNRVILATDGDFNIGASSVEAMKTLIAKQRDSGVFLSVLGFGRGNLNDDLMQTLAQEGNGQAAYIDTLAEARKALVEETAAFMPIAADVKIQIEFNPAAVKDYRLIGYETRALNREDFNNDQVDAGEIGAGHRVTAIYEITPVGGPSRIDDLRYGNAAERTGAASELAFLKLRHKAPGGDESQLTEIAITPDLAEAGQEARFAVAVAGFGERLRGSDELGAWSYDDVIAMAAAAKGEDRFGYRAEFLDLVRLARALDR